MRLLVAVLVLSLAGPALAGCFGKPDLEKNTVPGATPDRYVKEVRGVLPAALSLDTRWIKPGESVTATASPVQGTGVTYAWLTGKAPAAGGGHDHSGAAPAPKEQLTASATTSFHTGDLESGQAAEVLFKDAGIYRLHCHPHPGMKGNVTVTPGAKLAGVQHVAIWDDGRNLRNWGFFPENLEVAPGTRIIFHNNGTAMHTATQEAFEPPLTAVAGASGPTASISFPEVGEFRVVLRVSDASGARGETSQVVLVDAAKVDTYKQLYKDSFAFGGIDPAVNSNLPVHQVKQHAFRIDYPGVLVATLTATSPVPVSAVKVTLVSGDGGGALGEIPSGLGGTLTATLPAGTYVLRVDAEKGGQIEYSIDVQVALKMTEPPADDHGEGGGHDH